MTPSDILRQTVKLLAPDGPEVNLEDEQVNEQTATTGNQPDQQTGEEHLTTEEKIFRTRSALYGEPAAKDQMNLSEDNVKQLKESIAHKLNLTEA